MKNAMSCRTPWSGRRSLSCALVSALAVACSSSSSPSATGVPAEQPAQVPPITPNPASGDQDLALSSVLPEQCAGPEIVRIDRPVSGNQAASRGHFSYGFRFKAPSMQGAPVLVSLPGGPGQSSTGTVPAFIPAGWGYLLTDPRGVGCNTLATLPRPDVSSAFFQTTELARDVVAAIKERSLQNYVLFGVSYGTLLGTAVAHEAEVQNVPAPTAVVLEGVLGRAFGDTFVGAEYIHQWEGIRRLLPADVIAELDTKPSPYGITPEGWSQALSGFLPYGPATVAKFAAALSTTQPQPTRDAALGQFRTLAEAHPLTAPGEVELYRQIACREIADTVPQNDLDVVFDHGKMVRNSAQEGTKCAGLRVVNPYDSAKLQFGAKVYYFVGEADVATPAWQGAYHFEHHAGPAVRVVTEGGGHNSLGLDQGACAVAIMESIAGGGGDLQTVLRTCPRPVQVDMK